MSPRDLEITEGLLEIACVQQTPKGALRFFAKCCNTPIASTLRMSWVPFLSVLHRACVDWEAMPEPVEHYIGPIRARVNHTFARAKAKKIAGTFAPLFAMIVRFSFLTMWWMLRGDQRRSSFFVNGRAVVSVTQLF